MTTALAPLANAIAFDPHSEEFRATATHMAKTFREGIGELRRLSDALKANSQRMYEAFKTELDREDRTDPFGVAVNYDHRNYWQTTDDIAASMKRKAWALLVNNLGIKNVMSIKTRKEWEKKLSEGDLPDIHEDMIIGLILSFADNLAQFATDAAKEVFELLRPSYRWRENYKTNNAFKVGRRVILSFMVSPGYGGKAFRVNYQKDQHILAIDSVFSLLDGSGPIRDYKSPLSVAIEACDGKGETTYFRFKCYRNGNLHLEFKRLDLVKQLNGLAVGSFELGRDEEQVA